MKQSSVIRKINNISKQIPWNDQKIPEINLSKKNVVSKIDSLVNQLLDTSTNSNTNSYINSNINTNKKMLYQTLTSIPIVGILQQ